MPLQNTYAKDRNKLSMKNIKIISLLLSIFLSSFFVSAPAVFAQDVSLSFATYVPIKDKNVPAGSIVSFAPNGNILTKNAYDPLMIGVVVANPAVAIQIESVSKTYPIVTTGTTPVRVSTENGNIKKGDLITSSTTPGVGIKGGKSGYVVGAAIDDYSGKGVDTIQVAVDIHYQNSSPNVSSNLLDVFNLSVLATYDQPHNVCK